MPRPLMHSAERLPADEGLSVSGSKRRTPKSTSPFAWYFLMTHGHWVDPDAAVLLA
ncbi:hypothetical protein [Ensifer aridi]|uniref:hypothetical protein n=1 Tax=Ensifer aridi TaxID=1708715 RepID=UPI001430BAD3|nr:hypothetical protein [Ensifer aridi]